MGSMIRKEDKRDFLVALLETSKFKSRTSVLFLSTITKTFDLDRVHFVTDVSGLPISMTVPLLDTKGSSKFVIDHGVCTVEEWLLGGFRSAFDGSDFYVKIDMLETHALYSNLLSILETNDIAFGEIEDTVVDEIDMLLQRASLEVEIAKLTSLIDEALDNKDNELFAQYSGDYIRLVNLLEELERGMSTTTALSEKTDPRPC